MKITKKQLFEMIKKEALKVKKEIFKEQIEKVEDPLTVDMTKFDSDSTASDNKKSLVYKNKTKTEEKEGPQTNELEPYDEKAKDSINSQDSDQGHDKEIATAVEVEAGATKGGDGHTAGQKEGKFTSKKDNPKKEVSAPFDEKTFDGKMNTEDRLVDEKAKTYVDAGEKISGDSHTKGQPKANVSEKAPVVKDKKPIADGIEIKGSNVKLKENYSKKELLSFIKEEAKKLSK